MDQAPVAQANCRLPCRTLARHGYDFRVSRSAQTPKKKRRADGDCRATWQPRPTCGPPAKPRGHGQHDKQQARTSTRLCRPAARVPLPHCPRLVPVCFLVPRDAGTRAAAAPAGSSPAAGPPVEDGSGNTSHRRGICTLPAPGKPPRTPSRTRDGGRRVPPRSRRRGRDPRRGCPDPARPDGYARPPGLGRRRGEAAGQGVRGGPGAGGRACVWT